MLTNITESVAIEHKHVTITSLLLNSGHNPQSISTFKHKRYNKNYKP